MSILAPDTNRYNHMRSSDEAYGNSFVLQPHFLFLPEIWNKKRKATPQNYQKERRDKKNCCKNKKLWRIWSRCYAGSYYVLWYHLCPLNSIQKHFLHSDHEERQSIKDLKIFGRVRGGRKKMRVRPLVQMWSSSADRNNDLLPVVLLDSR